MAPTCLPFRTLENLAPWAVSANFSDMHQLSRMQRRAKTCRGSALPLDSIGTSRRENQPQGCVLLGKNGTLCYQMPLTSVIWNRTLIAWKIGYLSSTFLLQRSPSYGITWLFWYPHKWLSFERWVKVEIEHEPQHHGERRLIWVPTYQPKSGGFCFILIFTLPNSCKETAVSTGSVSLLPNLSFFFINSIL